MAFPYGVEILLPRTLWCHLAWCCPLHTALLDCQNVVTRWRCSHHVGRNERAPSSGINWNYLEIDCVGRIISVRHRPLIKGMLQWHCRKHHVVSAICPRRQQLFWTLKLLTASELSCRILFQQDLYNDFSQKNAILSKRWDVRCSWNCINISLQNNRTQMKSTNARDGQFAWRDSSLNWSVVNFKYKTHLLHNFHKKRLRMRVTNHCVRRVVKTLCWI